MEGKVYIVGAGPGDPELLTFKAQRAISQADTIFYDRLVCKEVLEHAKPGCELFFVGKRESRHFVTQDETNRLLIEHARMGRVVVRLKGGDPFIFGRGAEEEMALWEAGIPYETVPGISSSYAAPAAAGIPLTHRHLARSFTVVTGHLAKDVGDEIDWVDYVKVDTLVIMMGVGRREYISKALINAGRNPDEPVAFVYKGTTPQQRVIQCRLRDVAAGQIEVRPPAVMVVGQVVSLREHRNCVPEIGLGGEIRMDSDTWAF